jgi:hypothetical protein
MTDTNDGGSKDGSSEPTIELTASELMEAVGEQIILEGEAKPYGYLTALALDAMRADSQISDPVELLLEYFRNEAQFDLSEAQLQELELIFDDAYTPPAE